MNLKIKQIDGYWVDKNNNMWDCYVYTQEQAEKFSRTLIDCHNCINCYNCHNCCSCLSCHDCYRCHHCNSCYSCYYCISCNSCHSCHSCYFCYKCRDYKSNPQRYVTAKIGSRNDQTTFYYGKTERDMEIQVFCGSFRGTIEEFEQAVLKTHADNDKYREQYLKEIAKVKVLFELED